MEKEFIHLSLLLFRDYKRIWIPITILGGIFWTLDKIIEIHPISPYYYIFSNPAHILFGVWLFISMYIIIYTTFFKSEIHNIWNKKVLGISLYFILLVSIFLISILLDVTNEFTNDYSGENWEQVYSDDIIDLYCDVFGTIIIFLFTMYRLKYIPLKKKKQHQ